MGLNWRKCLDWADFYIYVPVYISTTLWPWVVFSSAVLHYFPQKRERVQLHLLKRTMYHNILFSLCVFFFFGLVSDEFHPLGNIRGVFFLLKSRSLKYLFTKFPQFLLLLTFWSPTNYVSDYCDKTH